MTRETIGPPKLRNAALRIGLPAVASLAVLLVVGTAGCGPEPPPMDVLGELELERIPDVPGMDEEFQVPGLEPDDWVSRDSDEYFERRQRELEQRRSGSPANQATEATATGD